MNKSPIGKGIKNLICESRCYLISADSIRGSKQLNQCHQLLRFFADVGEARI